ncbi:hypothetical protein BDQ17DRAFT_1275753 [Cyathus striatus]|nr:hypothetical protein BDQ17DRAFT_1275753 [Cyathus striatus]
MQISGPASVALASLTPSQLAFIHSLPKAELHAHLNGSIPLHTLQSLAQSYLASSPPSSYNALSNTAVLEGIQKLQTGPKLGEINDFFTLFPAIYALTSTPEALRIAAHSVLSTFLSGPNPQCTYMELRSTPRETDAMSRETYVRTVLEEVESYPADKAALIVSLDRKMSEEVVKECIGIAKKLRGEGRRVVGVDLCGDPTAGEMDMFGRYFREAKEAGLGVTLHIAETKHNLDPETLKLLSYAPDRLGHATFLNDEAKEIVFKNKICIEICLSSNLLCKTVSDLDTHHIRYYLKHRHPIAICTDDILPFRTSLDAEYALLLAPSPLGLGLSEEEVKEAADFSLAARFNK